MKKTYDYIHLLCAGIKEDNDGTWVSTDLSEADLVFGAPGGKLRILATAALAASHPDSQVFTGGGSGYSVPAGSSKARPLLAEILRDELLLAGVPLSRIIFERESNNTYQELIELEKFADTTGRKTFTVVTNRWHAARVQAMLEVRFSELSAHADIEIIAAEDVLIEQNSELWKEAIDLAYRSEWMNKLSETEARGIRQIKDGTYKFR